MLYFTTITRKDIAMMKRTKFAVTMLTALGVACTGIGVAGTAAAQGSKAGKDGIEQCMDTVLKQKPGKVAQLEKKIENGKPTFEFEVTGNDGKNWDVECTAGKVTEIEQNVGSADDPLFKAKMKISEDEAKKIALKAHPGNIEEPTDFEIEPDGKASYEFDIQTEGGKEMKVEVDATSGKIVEANQELWGIGEDESANMGKK